MPCVRLLIRILLEIVVCIIDEPSIEQREIIGLFSIVEGEIEADIGDIFTREIVAEGELFPW